METAKDIIEKEGITNENAERILKAPVSAVEVAREEANKIRESEGLVKYDVPVNVVEVPYNPVYPVEVPEKVHLIVPQKKWSEDELALIKAKVAGNCTDTEFKLLMYLAKTYNLDPLARQIWAVKFGDAPAQIYAGRDGYLAIAQRSGLLDGFESGVRIERVGKMGKVEEHDEYVGWCKITRKDMKIPFYGEAYFSEYSTGKNLWLTKPRVMIQKVAESMTLRKAFSVSGLYSPEEMGQ